MVRQCVTQGGIRSFARSLQIPRVLSPKGQTNTCAFQPHCDHLQPLSAPSAPWSLFSPLSCVSVLPCRCASSPSLPDLARVHHGHNVEVAIRRAGCNSIMGYGRCDGACRSAQHLCDLDEVSFDQCECKRSACIVLGTAASLHGFGSLGDQWKGRRSHTMPSIRLHRSRRVPGGLASYL